MQHLPNFLVSHQDILLKQIGPHPTATGAYCILVATRRVKTLRGFTD